MKYFPNNKITTPPNPPKVKYTGTVMVNELQHKMPTSKQCSHGRRHHRGRPAHREEEGQVANGSAEFQSFQVDTKGATSMGGRQSMLPCQISTPSQSEIKSVSNNRYCSSTSRTSTPSQSKISGFLSKCPYYQPQEDQDTYYINSEGHLQCHQDSQNIIKAPTPPGASRVKRSTLSFTNLAQSRSAVWRTFLNFTLTVLIDLALSRESMTSRLTQQCHQYSMQGGRCQ